MMLTSFSPVIFSSVFCSIAFFFCPYIYPSDCPSYSGAL